MTREIADDIARLSSHATLRMPVTIELACRVWYGRYFTLKLYFHEPKASENTTPAHQIPRHITLKLMW